MLQQAEMKDAIQRGDFMPFIREIKRLETVMDKSRFQHTEAELRYVADILAVLNKTPDKHSSVGVEGEIRVYWCDRVMGTIRLDDSEDFQSWCYFPAADSECEVADARHT